MSGWLLGAVLTMFQRQWIRHPRWLNSLAWTQLNVAWLLDDQMEGEGCLLVWPRSHLRDFEGATFNQLSDDFPGLSLEGSISVEGKAGDAVIFVSNRCRKLLA